MEANRTDEVVGMRYIYDSDIIAELRRFGKEKNEAIRVFPNRLWDIKTTYSQLAFRLLLEHGKI